MNDTTYTLETNVEAYRTLRDVADSVEEDPATINASDYDAFVEIGGEEYGVNFEGEYAKSEARLLEAGAEVHGTRERRGSLSAKIISDDLEQDMTVAEAANQGLEEETPQEDDVPVDQSPTAGRYGFDKAVGSD